jgi:hypothetical protein
MGYPLFFATVYGSWMVLKGVPTTIAPEDDTKAKPE